MQVYEEHTLISQAVVEIKNYITKRYDICDNIAELIAEYALTLYKVIKTPTVIGIQELVFTNNVYVNIKDIKHPRIKLGPYIYNVVAYPGIQNNTIAINGIQRKDININADDEIPITPVTAQFPEIENLSIEMTTSLDSSRYVGLNKQKIMEHIAFKYQNQIFTIGQNLLYTSFCDKQDPNLQVHLQFKIKSIDLKNSELIKPRKYTIISRGMLTMDSKIDIDGKFITWL